MKLHLQSFDPFRPSRLLIRPANDAYEELGHAYVSATEAQHATKLRSRQMAASAVKYLRERQGSGAPVMEPEVVKVLQLLGEAMVRGLDHPVPFAQETHLELRKIMGETEEKLRAWQLVLAGLVQAAEQEMGFEEFVIFEVFASRLMGLCRFLQAAVAMAPHVEAMTEEATLRFLAYCRGEGGAAWSGEEEAATRALLKDFYAGLSEVLGTAAEAEVRLFLVRFAAERLAVRFECNLQEWQFLFATLEQCLQNRVGLEVARHVSGLFQHLQDTASMIGFAGGVHRRMEEIKGDLAAAGFPEGLDAQSLVQSTLGELLMGVGRSEEPQPPLHTWAILNGQSVFSSCRPEDFRRGSKLICEALVYFFERAWVDWLEEPLRQMSRAVEWVAARRKAGQWMEGLADRSAKNLAEGLEVLRTNIRLSGDLVALINHACLTDIYFHNPEQQRAYLRRWFVVNIALAQLETGWQHGKTIAATVRTNFASVDPSVPLYERVQEAIEHWEHLEAWVREAGQAAAAWPHLTAHALETEKFISGATCQRDALWVLRKLVLTWLHLGARRAPRATLRWIGREIVPNAVHPTVEEFVQTYRKLKPMVEANESLRACGLAALVDGVVEGTARSVLGVRLWMESQAIAEHAAEQIYGKLPEYAEEAEARRGAFGETSRQLCARDQSLILRRISLGLDPEVEDTVEFVELWWNNLVNAYIRTRTKNLFAVQLQALKEATAEKLGSTAGETVGEVLSRILPVGEVKLEAGLPERLKFRSLESVALVRRELARCSSLLGSWAEEQTGDLSRWLEEHRASVLSLATEHPIAGVSEESEEKVMRQCEDCLAREWFVFWLHGALDDRACAEAHELWNGEPARCAQWERFVMGWMTAAASEAQPGQFSRVIYFGHWLDWLRQARAGFVVAKEADEWAAAVAAHVHAVIPQKLAAAGHAPDEAKCRRDYGHVLRALGQMLRMRTGSSVRLHLNRYLVQMVLPYTRYDRETWAMMWRAAEFRRSRSEDHGVEAVISQWLRELEDVGHCFQVIEPISQKINGGDEPVFSAEPREEAAWRDSVNLLLALAALGSEREERALAQWADEAVRAVPLDLELFGGRMDAVMGALRDWFLDLDLKVVRRASTALLGAWKRHRLMSGGLGRLQILGPKMAQFLKVAEGRGSALLLGALREVVGAPRGPEPLGLPVAVTWVETLPGCFPGEAAPEVHRLRTALGNLLGEVPEVEPLLEEGLSRLGRLIEQHRAVSELWKMIPGMEPAPEAGESRAQDQEWLARRVAVAGVMEEQGASQVLEWFGEQIVRYPGHLETAQVLGWAETVRKTFGTVEAKWPRLKRIIDEVVEGIPGLMVARMILTQAHDLADRVMQRSGVGETDGIDPVKCRRDVGLLLTTSGWQLAGGKPDPAGWFQSAIAPHLQEPAHRMASKVYGAFVELAKEEWHPLESAVVEKSFRPLVAP